LKEILTSSFINKITFDFHLSTTYIFSSSMSTGLNAMSGVLVNDLLSGVITTKRISNGVLLRLAAALMGAVCVALVFVVEHLGGVLQATKDFSLINILSYFFAIHVGGIEFGRHHLREPPRPLHLGHVRP